MLGGAVLHLQCESASLPVYTRLITAFFYSDSITILCKWMFVIRIVALKARLQCPCLTICILPFRPLGLLCVLKGIHKSTLDRAYYTTSPPFDKLNPPLPYLAAGVSDSASEQEEARGEARDQELKEQRYRCRPNRGSSQFLELLLCRLGATVIAIKHVSSLCCTSLVQNEPRDSNTNTLLYFCNRYADARH